MRLNSKLAIYAAAIAAVLLYGMVGSYMLGGNGNFSQPIKTPLDAAYFVVVTVSTVGYGDIVPLTEAARVFTIVLVLSGLSIFLSAVAVLSSDFLGERVEKLYSGISRMERRHLRSHVVLIGYDAANAIMAQRLMAEKKNFLIVVADKPLADSLHRRGYNAYVADYTLSADMKKFALQDASHIVIDLKDSSKTVYVVLVVRKLARDVNLSVVAPSMEAEEHLSNLNINNIINPVTIAADMLSKVLEGKARRRRKK